MQKIKMNGKRGSSHIDWVISIGIFIVYILLLLTWIKPGYKPVFETDILIDIAQTTIEEKYNIDTSKTFLRIKGCSAATGAYSFNLDDYSSGFTAGKFKVLKFDETPVLYKDKLKLQTYSISNNDYWIISSNSYSYGQNPGNLDTMPVVETCTSIFVGEPIVIKGLMNTNLQGLKGYLEDKGFPESRDYKISIYDIDAKNTVCYSRSANNCDLEPDSNAIVYSREWRHNILNPADGSSKPVLITIMIW